MTSVEMLTPLSRVFPSLIFRVGLMCEGEVEHYLIRRGRARMHQVSQHRMGQQYRRYGKRHGMTLEEMEEAFYPLSDAEWEVFNETFDYWHKVAPAAAEAAAVVGRHCRRAGSRRRNPLPGRRSPQPPLLRRVDSVPISSGGAREYHRPLAQTRRPGSHG